MCLSCEYLCFLIIVTSNVHFLIKLTTTFIVSAYVLWHTISRSDSIAANSNDSSSPAVMSEIQRGIEAISREPANQPIIKQFLRFFTAVAVIPVCVFALTIRLTHLTSPALSPPILAGIAAVFSLNLILALFALLAVREQSSPPSSTQEEQSTVTGEHTASHEKDE